MKSRNSVSLKCRSTARIATILLVVGSTISSLLLVSFHYKSSLQNFRHGPPLLSDFSRNHISRPSNGKRTISFGSGRPTKRTQNHTAPFATKRSSANNQTKTDTVHTHSDSGCFLKWNTRSWLEDKRFGNQNSHDSRIIDNDYIASSILNTTALFSNVEENSQNILRHTLCEKHSRFKRLTFSSFAGHDNEQLHRDGDIARNQTIHQLSLRLLYLSVHVHQHRHAMTEAKHRLSSPETCEREMMARKIGRFDFECPDAKFLVVPMKHSGLGGQLRLITAPALMAGIASDRVVLFVNNAPVGPGFLREPWDLSSCPRRDKQCFFLPDSPCVLTHTEVQKATVLGKGERRVLFKTGRLPDHMEGERVIVMNMKDRPQRTPSNFRSKIADIARQFLVDPLARESPSDPRLPMLSAAVDHILQEDESVGALFPYYGRNFQAHHAMVFFATRPRVEFAERIDQIVDGTLGDNHRTDLALGLPIRASDKCLEESECPSFETYMLLMQTVWDANAKPLADTRRNLDYDSTTTENSSTPFTTDIIVTSESPDVFQDLRDFQERENNHQHKNLSFPFKFVTNDMDVLQNTGNPSKMSTTASSKEDIIVSALASLKMQFYAKYSVGNCCSNHHLLLFDFLSEGCGASDSDHVANCMQDHEDERFRICCGWTKTEECLARRAQQTALQQTN